MPGTKNKLLFGGAVFILLLSVVTFVFIPASTSDVSGHEIIFGKWNGKPIQYQQDSYFLRQVQQLSEQMQGQGQEINQFAYYQVMDQAFKNAAVRLAILDDLSSAGYKVPASKVNKELVPYYQDKNGKYSAKAYNDTAESTRASRRTIMTEELTAQRYIEDTFGTQTGLYGLKTSSKETDLVKTMAGPERSFNYVSYAIISYPAEELTAFGKANAELFTRHDLSLITVDNEATAKKAASAIAKKESTFEDAVTTYSTRVGTDSAGILAKNLRSDLNELFTDAKDLDVVIALQSGADPVIVKTGKKFALVRCNAAPTAPDFANADTLNAVFTYMNEKERGKLEDYFVNQAKGFVDAARASDFDAACKASAIEKKTTAAFSLNYGNINILSPVPVDANPEFKAAVKNEAFFKSAFSLAPGAVSDPIILGNNVVVLQLAEEKAVDSQIAEMLPVFFNYYAGSWSQKGFSDAVLKSPKLTNNFMETYLKNFVEQK